MNIGIGNDIRLSWRFIGHDKQEVDFSGTRKVEIVVRHSRYSNITYIPPALNIVNGTIAFEISNGNLIYPGIYHVEMNAIWPSEEYADGDRKVSSVYRGAFSLSSSGNPCADVELVSQLCVGYEHPEGQQVTVLKARWGYIIGRLEDQEDLMSWLDELERRLEERIDSLDLNVAWGEITGNIENQTDLIDFITNKFVELFEKYGGGSAGNLFTITAAANDTLKGTVSPTKLIVKGGESATLTASAKAGNFIKEWEGAEGAEVSGVGQESGTVVIKDVQENKNLTCIFEAIPSFGLSASTLELLPDGSLEKEVVVFTTKGWAIQGGLLSEGNTIRINWSADDSDCITITRGVLASGKERIQVASTANNTGVNRQKTIVFLETETNKNATLVVSQAKSVGYKLTTNTAGTGSGEITSVTPAAINGYYTKGTVVTLVANDGAESSDQFDYWMVDGVKRTERTISVTMNKNITATAYFKKRNTSRYLLTTSTAGAGSGQITSITPTSADGYYAADTVVTLVANNGDSINDYFDHWLINGESKSTLTVQVTMNTNVTATAYFRCEGSGVTEYTLNVSAEVGGTVSGGGTYQAGVNAEIRATPGANYDFTGWAGDASGNDNPLIVFMDRNKNITATFRPKPVVDKCTLTINIVGESWGYTNLYGANSSQHDHQYNRGEVVTLNAYPYATGEFVGWTGDVTESASSIQITMDTDKSVTATFRKKETTGPTEYTIQTNVTPANGGTVGVVDNTTHWSVTATPASGWRFNYWTGDVTTAQRENPSIAVQKDGNKNLVAVFVANTSDTTYALAVTGSPKDVSNLARFAIDEYASESAGSVSVRISGGQIVTIRCASLPTGYRINGWTDNQGNKLDSGSPYFSYTMPERDVAITANFVEE